MSRSLLEKVSKLFGHPALDDWDDALQALEDRGVQVHAVMSERFRTSDLVSYEDYFTRGNRQGTALIHGMVWSWSQLAHGDKRVEADYCFTFSEDNHAELEYQHVGIKEKGEDFKGTWLEVYEKIVDLITPPEVPPLPKR